MFLDISSNSKTKFEFSHTLEQVQVQSINRVLVEPLGFVPRMCSDITRFSLFLALHILDSIAVEKKRSQSDKIGRLKYNQQLLKQTLAEVEEVKLMLHTIFAGLKGSFNFEQSLIERIACEDDVDREILQVLFEAGSSGVLPKNLAVKLQDYRVTRHQISKRILRMNKRIEQEFGEQVAKQRGWHWALTSFAMEVWGESKRE